MLRLMNSAMMPNDGIYTRRQISFDEFKEIFDRHSEFISYIGYPQLARILSANLKTRVDVNLEQTELRDGDKILVAKLPYRVPRGEKGQGRHGGRLQDYEFFYITYRREIEE